MGESPSSAAVREPSEEAVFPDVSAFTRERVERVMASSVALGFSALAAQSFVAAIGSHDADPQWGLALILVAFVPIVVMEVAFFTGRAVAICGWSFVLAYVAVLLMWPFATAGRPSPIDDQPWIYFLINVATVAAVIVMPLPAQLVVTIIVPVIYGSVRMIQLDFAGGAWAPVWLDALYSLILGSVLLVLAWTVRGAARRLDEQRARAVDSYARAAAAAATERERVAVAALMHDSVLAALIAAERAGSARERQLAVSMAREALTRLANTGSDREEGSDAPVSAQKVAERIRGMIADAGVSAEVGVDIETGTPDLPGRVARALVLATTQAVQNAVEHADAAGLAVFVAGRRATGEVEVVVRDRGKGFDPRAIPADRLGIRASIIARMSAFGGEARIESGTDGTAVALTWRSGAE